MKEITYQIRNYYGDHFDIRATLDHIPNQKEFKNWCSWYGNWKLVKVTTFTTEIKPKKSMEIGN